MPQSTCCTCARFLSETKIPRDHKSEKPLAFDRHLECCERVICASCQYKNPRFQAYCPFCQISSEPTSLPQNGLRLPPAYTKTSATKPDDERSLRAQLASTSSDVPPPPYTATYTTAQPSASTPTETAHTTDASPSYPSSQDTTHHLSPDDTLQSLSLAYAVPTPVLQSHNNLWAAHLLAGRKTISIPATHYQGPPLSTPPDPVEERRKVKVRRWMVATKCADYKVAELYLKGVAGDIEGVVDANGTQSVPGGAMTAEEREDDRIVQEAVERFKADEEWERKNPLNGKNKAEGRGKRRRGAGGSLAAQLF